MTASITDKVDKVTEDLDWHHVDPHIRSAEELVDLLVNNASHIDEVFFDKLDSSVGYHLAL